MPTLLELHHRELLFRCLHSPTMNLTGADGGLVDVLQALRDVDRRERSRAVKAGMTSKPAGRPRALTDNQVDIARELRRFDRSHAHIARVLGVSTSAVYRALNPTPPPPDNAQ